MNHRLKINIFFVYFSQAINIITPLLLIPYLSKVLSIEHFGVVMYAISLVAYLSIICDYGFAIIAVREVALAKSDFTRLDKIFSSILYCKAILLILALLIGFLIILLVPTFYTDRNYFLLSLLNLFYSAFFPFWFFQGVGKMLYITVCNFVSKLLSVILTLYFVKNDYSLYYIVYINLFSNSVILFLSHFIIVSQWKFTYKLPKIEDISMQMKEGFTVFLSTIAISCYTVANSFLLGVFSSPTIVGYYSIAEKITSGVQSLIAPIAQVMFPFLSHEIDKDIKKGLILVKKELIYVGAFTFCLSLGLYLLSPIIIQLLFGHKYIQSVQVLKVLAFIPFLVSISNILGIQTMIPLGMKQEFSKILIVAGIINLVMIFIFVPKYNILASPWCVLLTELLVTLAMILALQKKRNLFFNE